MSKLEEVARALCGHVGAAYDALPERATYMQRKTHPDRAFADQEEAKEAARAAIEAMKEPTFEMVDAPAALEIDPGTAHDVWRAMIDKAMER